VRVDEPGDTNAPRRTAPGILDIGSGVQERLGFLNQTFNPVEGIGGAMRSGSRMMAPDQSYWDRIASLGEMASGVAGIAAPIAAARAIGVPAASAMMEGLLGFSPTTQAAGDTMRAAGRDIVDRLNQPGPVPVMYSNPIPGVGMGGGLDVSRRDASNIFGAGSERVRYTDPQSGGTIEVVVRPDGSASVLELEVPEASRGQGIGQTLQERVMQDFPVMGGQVSSKAAATTAYRLGRRPPGKPDATLEEVFADIDEMSSVNMVSPRMQERIAPAAPTLPTPRNEAETMARDILQLRAEGRADEVTEQMMDAADPQYMYANTPLPMDYASRMARAEAMGARPEYHGTTIGSEMRYPRTDYSSGTRKGIGFVTSSDPYVSSSYADPSFGSVFPMMNRVPSGGYPTIDAGGGIWSEIPGEATVSYAGREMPVSSYAEGRADVGGVFDTNQIARGALFREDPGVQFNNILDRSIHAPRPKTDDGMEIMREFQRRSSEPSTVTMRQDTRGMRSRFARFDPAFANLRNLSAGVGGAAVLTALGDDAEAGTPEMQIIGLVNQAGIAGAAEALGVSRRDIEEAMSIVLPPSQWDQLVVGPQ
jgi:hypothetical protein